MKKRWSEAWLSTGNLVYFIRLKLSSTPSATPTPLRADWLHPHTLQSPRFHINTDPRTHALQNRWQKLADGHVRAWINTNTHARTLYPLLQHLSNTLLAAVQWRAVWLPVLQICSWSERSPSALAWLPWCMHTQTLDNLSAFTYAASALHTTSEVRVRRERLRDLPCIVLPAFARRAGEDEEVRWGEMAALARLNVKQTNFNPTPSPSSSKPRRK